MSYRYCYQGGVAPSTLNPANRETMLGACVNILRPNASLWANRLYSVGKEYTLLITASLPQRAFGLCLVYGKECTE